jgi:hypothetical protein
MHGDLSKGADFLPNRFVKIRLTFIRVPYPQKNIYLSSSRFVVLASPTLVLPASAIVSFDERFEFSFAFLRISNKSLALPMTLRAALATPVIPALTAITVAPTMISDAVACGLLTSVSRRPRIVPCFAVLCVPIFFTVDFFAGVFSAADFFTGAFFTADFFASVLPFAAVRLEPLFPMSPPNIESEWKSKCKRIPS